MQTDAHFAVLRLMLGDGRGRGAGKEGGGAGGRQLALLSARSGHGILAFSCGELTYTRNYWMHSLSDSSSSSAQESKDQASTSQQFRP